MSYDHITRDLCRKASKEMSANIKRTGALLDDPADQMMVAISAASVGLAAATGYATALIERDTGQKPAPEAVLNTLWDMIQPIALKSSGGDDAPFRALLAACAGNGEKHGG